MDQASPARPLPEVAEALAAALPGLPLPARLRAIRAAIPGPLVFTTSLGLEDQLILAAIAQTGIAAEVATLDTGRLFPQTYALWRETEAATGIPIRALYPRHEALEALVGRQGIDGFYASVEARKACCAVRKVEPLGRALAGAAGWITGLRADQSEQRGAAAFAAYDAERGLAKLSPLLDYTRERVAADAAAAGIPVNPLHAQGFLSIGCAPCTRAVAPGESERAGRWWWEEEAGKECGLHVGPDGRLRRAAPGQVRA